MFHRNRYCGLPSIAVGVAAAGVVATGSACHADLQYTQEMRMGKSAQDPKTPPMMTTTRSSRQDALREETTTQFGTFKMRSVHLTVCPEKKRYEIDPALKIYTVESLDEPKSSTGQPAASAPSGAPAQDDSAPGTGKIIMTSSVKDLGEDVVADRKTRHYMTTMHMQSTGCAGNNDNTIKMEIWVAPGVKEEFHCAQSVPNIPSGRPPAMGGRSKCKTTMEFHGDTDAFSPYHGIQMREIMYQGDTTNVTMMMQITSISTDKLDDGLFSVPADFKEVTSDEFHQQQSRAMMQQMMGGHTPSSNNGSADNGNANTGNANNGAADNGNANNGNGDNGNGDNPPPKKKPKFPFNIPGL